MSPEVTLHDVNWL